MTDTDSAVKTVLEQIEHISDEQLRLLARYVGTERAVRYRLKQRLEELKTKGKVNVK